MRRLQTADSPDPRHVTAKQTYERARRNRAWAQLCIHGSPSKTHISLPEHDGRVRASIEIDEVFSEIIYGLER